MWTVDNILDAVVQITTVKKIGQRELIHDGKSFGVDPGAANPDDIWDFIVANPDKYEMVHPLEPLRGETG